jgi:hypothetical protein
MEFLPTVKEELGSIIKLRLLFDRDTPSKSSLLGLCLDFFGDTTGDLLPWIEGDDKLLKAGWFMLSVASVLAPKIIIITEELQYYC